MYQTEKKLLIENENCKNRIGITQDAYSFGGSLRMSDETILDSQNSSDSIDENMTSYNYEEQSTTNSVSNMKINAQILK